MPDSVDMWAEILRFKAEIKQLHEENPPEGWMHVRLVDGHWQVLQQGETPPAFFLGVGDVPLHNKMVPGDRIVYRERADEMAEDGSFFRVGGEQSGTAASPDEPPSSDDTKAQEQEG